METLNSYGVRKIVTICPHCFNTLKNEYSDFGGNYEVVPAIEYVQELLDAGKLKINPDYTGKITYHDSCYLARHNGIVNTPRDIISLYPNAEFIEMEMNQENAMCCGAGGGRVWFELGKGKEINHTRSEMAGKTGADTLGVSCPFCMIMLEDGMKLTDFKDVDVKDLLEIVAESLAE